MSLSINPNKIIGVYALGEWHVVARGSFYVDAYEIVEDGFVDNEPDAHVYHLGDYRPDMPSHNGASWIDPIKRWRVSMSLAEIKAYQEIGK